MECEYCKNVFSSTRAKNVHQQTTKSCLVIQQQLGRQIKKITYPCTFCKKEFTTKVSQKYHVNICKSKIEKSNNSSSEMTVLREKVVFLEKELVSLREEFSSLREKVIRNNLADTSTTNQSTQARQTQPTQLQPKPSKKIIPKAIKTMVWNLYIGSSIAQSTCMCCTQEKITIRDYQCGHVLSEANGGEMNISNLRPICSPCNKSMGTQHMGEFVKTFFGRDLV
jgi:hypothetical protein